MLLTVSEGSTRRAAKLAEEGAKAGAAGLMVLPAIPYRSDARETIAHYTSVTRAAGLPVMIYNNPVSYGVDITPAMLADMAAEPLFTAIKESSDDVRRVTQIFNQLGNRYAVFTGVDNLALESLAVGVDGWVAGLVCAFPAETVAAPRRWRFTAGSSRCWTSMFRPSWCRISSWRKRWRSARMMCAACRAWP